MHDAQLFAFLNKMAGRRAGKTGTDSAMPQIAASDTGAAGLL